MSNNPQTPSIDPQVAEKQTADLLKYSNEMIQQAMSSYDVSGFKPVPLDIPQIIQGNTPLQGEAPTITMPEISDYYKNAENVWRDIANNNPEQDAPPETQEMYAESQKTENKADAVEHDPFSELLSK